MEAYHSEVQDTPAGVNNSDKCCKASDVTDEKAQPESSTFAVSGDKKSTYLGQDGFAGFLPEAGNSTAQHSALQQKVNGAITKRGSYCTTAGKHALRQQARRRRRNTCIAAGNSPPITRVTMKSGSQSSSCSPSAATSSNQQQKTSSKVSSSNLLTSNLYQSSFEIVDGVNYSMKSDADVSENIAKIIVNKLNPSLCSKISLDNSFNCYNDLNVFFENKGERVSPNSHARLSPVSVLINGPCLRTSSRLTGLSANCSNILQGGQSTSQNCLLTSQSSSLQTQGLRTLRVCPPQSSPSNREASSPSMTTMQSYLASIPGFKPRKRTQRKLSTAAQLALTKEGNIDLETPDSILININLKSLVNVETYTSLPAIYQHRLAQLLPRVDQIMMADGTIRVAPAGFHNEFLARACVSWRERLREGEFTHDNQVKLKGEADRERSKLDPWKVAHFEPVWGMKQEDSERDSGSSRFDNLGEENDTSFSSMSSYNPSPVSPTYSEDYLSHLSRVVEFIASREEKCREERLKRANLFFEDKREEKSVEGELQEEISSMEDAPDGEMILPMKRKGSVSEMTNVAKRTCLAASDESLWNSDNAFDGLGVAFPTGDEISNADSGSHSDLDEHLNDGSQEGITDLVNSEDELVTAESDANTGDVESGHMSDNDEKVCGINGEESENNLGKMVRVVPSLHIRTTSPMVNPSEGIVNSGTIFKSCRISKPHMVASPQSPQPHGPVSVVFSKSCSNWNVSPLPGLKCASGLAQQTGQTSLVSSYGNPVTLRISKPHGSYEIVQGVIASNPNREQLKPQTLLLTESKLTPHSLSPGEKSTSKTIAAIPISPQPFTLVKTVPNVNAFSHAVTQNHTSLGQVLPTGQRVFRGLPVTLPVSAVASSANTVRLRPVTSPAMTSDVDNLCLTQNQEGLRPTLCRTRPLTILRSAPGGKPLYLRTFRTFSVSNIQLVRVSEIMTNGHIDGDHLQQQPPRASSAPPGHDNIVAVTSVVPRPSSVGPRILIPGSLNSQTFHSSASTPSPSSSHFLSEGDPSSGVTNLSSNGNLSNGEMVTGKDGAVAFEARAGADGNGESLIGGCARGVEEDYSSDCANETQPAVEGQLSSPFHSHFLNEEDDEIKEIDEDALEGDAEAVIDISEGQQLQEEGDLPDEEYETDEEVENASLGSDGNSVIMEEDDEDSAEKGKDCDCILERSEGELERSEGETELGLEDNEQTDDVLQTESTDHLKGSNSGHVSYGMPYDPYTHPMTYHPQHIMQNRAVLIQQRPSLLSGQSSLSAQNGECQNSNLNVREPNIQSMSCNIQTFPNARDQMSNSLPNSSLMGVDNSDGERSSNASEDDCPCNMRAMVACMKCGAFCHHDCVSSNRLCVTCFIR